MHEMWFQPSLPTKRPTSSVIAAPLEALEKKNSYVRAINLQTLKDVVGTKYPQYRGNLQNDAQEFLRHFISGLHEEMRPSERAIPKYIDATGLRLVFHVNFLAKRATHACC
jgi:ubiquitin C-terminal hydrolase